MRNEEDVRVSFFVDLAQLAASSKRILIPTHISGLTRQSFLLRLSPTLAKSSTA